MRKLLCLGFYMFSSLAFAKVTSAIKWPEGQELKIEAQQLVYLGLRHSVEHKTATLCHKHLLTEAQREILHPRRSCSKKSVGKRFDLIVNGQKQSVEVCSISAPQYQRTLEKLLSCK